VDEIKVGRSEIKRVWCLQTIPAPPPSTGKADNLNEEKAAFAKRYEEGRRGNDGPQRP